MSATHRPTRDGLDAYYTPDRLAEACVATMGNLRGLTVWEPHAGAGAFARAARARARNGCVIASDVAFGPERVELGTGMELYVVTERDALCGPAPNWTPIDVIVGNPPFRGWEQHVQVAIEHAPLVGFILRLGALAGARRLPWWTTYQPSEVHVIVPRPSFTGDGAHDASEYAWVVWDRRRRERSTELLWLKWRAAR